VADMQKYLDICREQQKLWAHQFITILSWSSILNVFILYFSFMIRAEGRIAFVVIAGVSCDLFNVLFDYLYISKGHFGMRGGGLATMTG
jgi:Na+-driven multidrug efflux pump